MLFFMLFGLRWESSGQCCLTERKKMTESAWRTTSDHHSRWKAGQCGPLLSSLDHQLWSAIFQDCSRIISEVETWIIRVWGLFSHVTLCLLLKGFVQWPQTQFDFDIELFESYRLYIFRSLLIHLDQACAKRSLLQGVEIFVLSKGPSWWGLISCMAVICFLTAKGNG